jgi:transposase
MKRFVEGEDRKQAVLLPEYLEGYVSDDNPVRVVDVFVDELDLRDLGFDGTAPAATGRPSYHPSVLLKIYVYGYLNRIQSSRRQERETQRNIELMRLTGRLSPDFKTIADFRRNNGKAIRNVCSQFIVLCRNLDLFSKSIVAIDGSKFKAVNNRDRNFTSGKVQARLQQIDESIARYLSAMETADRTQSDVTEAKTSRISDKISKLRQQMQDLKAIEQRLRESPDGQVSLTDPDARSMATSGRGTGTVGYNVQTAVDHTHHLIVAHEVTNVGNDRSQLTNMAGQARAATGTKDLTVVADFKSEEVLQCHEAGITVFVPKPLTSGKNADGYFGKQDFIYVAKDDEYLCPAQQRLNWRFTTIEHGMTLHCYSSSACSTCAIRKQCTSGKQARRIKRWEHEAVVEAMQQRLDQKPDMVRIRRQTVEHPFGTLKFWMGAAHFLMKTREHVSTEMSPHVLAYNLRRVMAILDTGAMMQKMRA